MEDTMLRLIFLVGTLLFAWNAGLAFANEEIWLGLVWASAGLCFLIARNSMSRS